MLNLNSLTVSLTKHGAHKVADLLKKYAADEVLDKLSGAEPGINIDEAQARATLAVGRSGAVPAVWPRAQEAGDTTINALVLIGIVFSHHKLIEAMAKGSTGPMIGIIRRGEVLDDKEYTNFAHVLDELGFGEEHSQKEVRYTLKDLFEIDRLNLLMLELLAAKLDASVWVRRQSLVSELVESKLNRIFGLSADQFRNWLATGHIGVDRHRADELFFLDELITIPTGSFHFKAGHSPKKTGAIVVSASSGAGTADLLHNKLQTALYANLVTKYGPACVGSEQPTGHGTSIDLVVRTSSFCWFYEIKVAPSLRACVRQAIPQLLEYAFWKQEGLTVDRLYIASTFKPTREVLDYLKLLRKRFGLPLYYEQVKP